MVGSLLLGDKLRAGHDGILLLMLMLVVLGELVELVELIELSVLSVLMPLLLVLLVMMMLADEIERSLGRIVDLLPQLLLVGQLGVARDLFGRLRVALLVEGQVVGAPEGLGAKVALEWALAGVLAPMPRELIAAGKP